ncbi:hypothetical protein [Nitrospirillum bahiense]|uniref:DUF2846 domain-containing protein n=1 Tax=Nitrospirillum amazonense TaxID=28077 RepID=A0A560FBA6_9PROT|nr:hypothetical protein [Nitrospirillum amazonense]TWB18901.1 hypothetical protein FBZ88_12357 [Nitrospirillum amazonense]
MPLKIGKPLLAALIATGTLLGCATGEASKDIVFSADSKKAIVVLGWEGLDQYGGTSLRLQFRGTSMLGPFDDRYFSLANGKGLIERQPTEYFVAEVDPGYYVVDSVDVRWSQEVIVRMCKGTIKFFLAPGKVTYIGNFASTFGGAAVKSAKPQPQAAAAKLAEFPHITQPMTVATVSNVPYPKREDCKI